MASLLRAGIAVFPDYKATMFSEWWAMTLLRHDTLLLARSCHAKQRLSFHKQAERAPPERECAHFLAW